MEDQAPWKISERRLSLMWFSVVISFVACISSDGLLCVSHCMFSIDLNN